MLQAMRERVKVIYWVVIVSFVGLMFLVWGVGDWNAPATSGSDGVVAVVGDTEISAQVWRQRANSIRDQMRARQGTGQSLTENQMMRARDQAFEELVTEALMRQQAEAHEAQVTDQEIAEILRNNPPQSLLAQFVDENGNPDYDAYYRALQSQNFPWGQIVRSMRANIPLQKFQQRLAVQALVSEAELRRTYQEQNAQAVIEYVGVKTSDVEVDETEPTDSEIQAWYEEHRDDYRQDERARARVATIDKAPSEADEAEILSIVEEIRQDIVAGRQTFEEAARIYSEDTTSDVGGDLGFFDRDRMVEAFTEVAFDLNVGEVSEPVRTQFGYHLIECVDEKLDDDGERAEVRARHILLKARPSQSTLDELRERAHSLREAAATQGIEQAAAADSIEVTTTPAFQEGFNVPGVPNSLPGSRFTFNNDVGAVSTVYETEDNFYVLEVAERLPAGYRPLEEVRSQVVTAIQRDRRLDAAAEKLRNALQSRDADTDLAQLAEQNELAHAVTDTFGMRESLPGVGFATALSRAAFAAEQGAFVDEVRTDNGVYAFEVLYRSPFDEEDFRAARASLARSLGFSRSRLILQKWLEEQRESVEIVDRRDQLL